MKISGTLKRPLTARKSCFGAVPVQYQFFELEARVAQQTLGACTVFTSVTRKDGYVLGPGGVRRDVIEHGIGIGDLDCSRVFGQDTSSSVIRFYEFQPVYNATVFPVDSVLSARQLAMPENMTLVFWRVPLLC
jgi:hypothetical protein